ncbi:MAG: flagellar hook-length control protein FliK [Lachnospiraceae bacterium]|nr:flagellar hook-length control protein FliK [Lachnospiraceae bacterium]
MQINDLVSQFNNSLKAGTQMKAGTKGIEQATNTLQSLKPGQIFEGSITNVKGNQVTISLSSGQNIQARLDQGVSISQGQSVFFEVKSNADNTIQIRPLENVVSNNPTLLTALDAAGIPANERNLTMVNTMMQEQMPIDAKSLQFMAQTLHMNPSTSADSIVLMQKLNIPITGEMIEQFENYKANEGAILKAVDELVNTMSETIVQSNISTEDAVSFQQNLVKLLQLNGEVEPEEENQNQNTIAKPLLSENPEGGETVNSTISKSESVVSDKTVVQNENVVDKSVTLQQDIPGKTGLSNQTTDILVVSGQEERIGDLNSLDGESVETLVRQEGATSNSSETTTISMALSGEQTGELNEVLKQFPELKDSMQGLLKPDGTVDTSVSVKEFLNTVTTALSSQQNVSRDALLKMISSSPYKSLLKNLMEESWTIKPESLKEENKIQNLYEKLEVHMKQLEEAAKQLTGNANNPFSKVAQNVQSNIEFMNQVNHAFTYVQIPLKFANQNATGDLYVYSNKRGKGEESDELSAFLHFDLEHLGSTDISVKLKNKNVDTQFFMDDDQAFELVQSHIDILQKRLEDKGYNAKITVSENREPVNLISDFLKKEVSVGNGDNIIQRYSFDVKA